MQNKPVNISVRTGSLISLLNKIAAAVSAIVLFGVMLLTVIDVAGRYFLNMPVKGSWELIGLFFVIVGTWGWAYCQELKGHVNVSVIEEKLRRRLQLTFRGINYLIGFVMFSLLRGVMFRRTIQYISIVRGGLSDDLDIPYYPFMLALTIGAGIMALTVLKDFVYLLTRRESK